MSWAKDSPFVETVTSKSCGGKTPTMLEIVVLMASTTCRDHYYNHYSQVSDSQAYYCRTPMMEFCPVSVLQHALCQAICFAFDNWMVDKPRHPKSSFTHLDNALTSLCTFPFQISKPVIHLVSSSILLVCDTDCTYPEEASQNACPAEPLSETSMR